ncbi:MAG TPA: hypothetical protein VGL66_06390 [Caulobacteraceae bacterium]|jgi:hypothetical protein
MFEHLNDPEIRREAERLRRGELARRDADLARRRRAEGSCVPVLSTPIELSTDEQIERAASNIVAGRRAWRKTPEGRFVAALNEARAAIDLAATAEHEARAAQSRSFAAERPACDRWSTALHTAAKRLTTAALDAQLAAMDVACADTAETETAAA